MSRIPPAVIEAVDARRMETCEATGWPTLHVQYHHRRPYRMGGRPADDALQNIAENILGLCRRHHEWAHAHGPGDPHGFMLRDDQDPRDVPVRSDPRLGRC